MILCWGLSGDGPLEAVHQALERRGARVAWVDQRQVLDFHLELELDRAGGGILFVRKEAILLDEVRAVYSRVYDPRQLADVVRGGEETSARALVVESALWSWVELTRARVVNRPSVMAANNSKPYQSALIQAQGFSVPETLVTTDPDEARRFWGRHRSVIYKSISGVRSIVSRLDVDHLSRLDDVVWCPTQFQQYIPGRDHRVHVVGDEVFGCEVVSDADDYRYAGRQGAAAELRACALPVDVAERCRRMAAAHGLLLAGVDLRRAPDGEWYCFEVNPSPCFTYYEEATGQPLTEAVANLLQSAHQ